MGSPSSMRAARLLLAGTVALLLASQAEGEWGTNIHFRGAGQPGETAMIGAAFKLTRMDMTWEGIEKVKGEYNFSAYDGLCASLATAGIRPYFILDYGNPLYDGGLSPYTDEGRTAFTAFAVAALTHFRGKGIVWELWNEPNGGFWKPKADAGEYAALALAVGAGIERAGLGAETLVGPAADGGWVRSMAPGAWMDTVFSRGVLRYFDAVSVHPYRGSGPETVLPDYAQLDALVRKYNNGTALPIISGEWGYSTCVQPCDPPTFTGSVTEADQAQLLPRQWLINRLAGVKHSIWYDWRNGCENTTMRECMFGTVHANYVNESHPYAPKPAYTAALVLQGLAGPLEQAVRLNASFTDPELEAKDLFAVQLASAATPVRAPVVAAWAINGTFTTCDVVPTAFRVDCGHYGIGADKCHRRGCCFQMPATKGPQCFYHWGARAVARLPLAAGCYGVQSHLGVPQPDACASAAGLVTVNVSSAPVYLTRKPA